MGVLLISLSLLSAVFAQLNGGAPGTSIADSLYNGSRICNGTFADANSTGFTTFNAGIESSTGDIRWAQTVFQSPNTTTGNQSVTELSTWFSPGSGNLNYSDSNSLGFDACYFWVSLATYNTWERGQNDTGGCVETLDEACVNDMNALTRQTALWLTGSPSGNLSADSLPDVCTTMAKQITDSFPDSCKPFFNDGPKVYGSPPSPGGPLTGKDSFVERAQCTLTDQSSDHRYALMWSQFGEATNTAYQVANWFVTPVITAFFPIANDARPVTILSAYSFMNCLRATTINNGSLPVIPAPSPTPVDLSSGTSSNTTSNTTDVLNQSSSAPATPTPEPSVDSPASGGLSGGAIAGVAVGATIGALALAGLLAFFLLRRRIRDTLHKKKSWEQFDKSDGASSVTEMHYITQSPPSENPISAVSELSDMRPPWAAPVELGGTAKVVELGGTAKFIELGGSVPPVELPTHRTSSHATQS